ncbi:MAG TPA: hypothetical protein VHM91_02795 [Verrucomicrobiales bacterium]|jgi:hypothetical protein|nr:hypothetical protein [Verrucomicrobiales bacterium]
MKNPKGKSYNEVMNEWAAQRSFLQRAGSGLLRPGFGVTGYARVWGWVWRFFLLVTIPLGVYAIILKLYGMSGEFTGQLSSQIKSRYGADHATFARTRWNVNGSFYSDGLKLRGAAGSFFHEMNFESLSTSIPLSEVFKADWHLKSVDTVKGTVSLRSGGAGKVAVREGVTQLLTAGWGIKPDFSKLVVDRYKADKLTLTWGGTPATSGGFADSATTLTRNEAGWELLALGGTFYQGWFDDVRLLGAKVQIGSGRAVIEKAEFLIPGGGAGSLTGSITLGEDPELDAVARLENTPFQQFLPEFFRPYVTAVCNGTIKLSGSTNRTTGILMDTNLTIQSGTVSGVPLFRALELATGETHVAQPAISGGRVHFTSQGTQENGGLLVEANDVQIDCGTTLKIALTIRHERKQVQASNAREAAHVGDSLSLTTTGTLRIGLPPETLAKLKPSIRQEFFTREDQGMHWMEAPYRMEDGEFTKDTADRIIALHNGG